MIKIPLKFINGQIIVNMIIASSVYRIGFQRIPFVFDTGSPESFLSERDALKLKLPLSQLSIGKIVNLASSKYNLLKTRQFSFYIKTQEEKSHKIDYENFLIAKTTKKKQENIAESQHLPSILGVDFLLRNNLILYFDPGKNEAYFIVKE